MSLAKSSLLFSAGTFLSRLAGLVRDRLALVVFGASSLHDAFLIAFRIPNMLRELLAEGALGNAFTKVYSEVSVKDQARAQSLLVDCFRLMTLASVVVCAAGITFAPWIVRAMTWMGDDASEHKQLMVHTAIGLTRLLFPFLGFMSLGAVAMGALHQKGRFFITAISPLAFNIGYILGAVVLSGWLAAHGPEWIERAIADRAMTGLALGVLLGGLGQLLVQLWAIRYDLRHVWQRRASLWTPDVRKVFLLMGPMVIAASAGQVNVLVNTMFASSLKSGSVTWLNYAFRLLHFPIGIFGVAIGAAVLPTLSRALAEAGGKPNLTVSREMQNAIELVLWLMTPCLALFMACRLELVQFLYQGGKFTTYDAQQTANALFAYGFSLLSYGLSKVFSSIYFALERTTYALRVSLFSMLVNFLINSLLVSHFDHVGLAFGYSVTLGVNIFQYAWGLRQEPITFAWGRLFRSLGAMSVALFLAIAISRSLIVWLAQMSWYESSYLWLSRGSAVFLAGVVTVFVFAASGLFVLRMSPRQAWAALKARRRRPVAKG